jgi:subtilisin family serine protease
MRKHLALLYLLISLLVLFTASFPRGQTGSFPKASEPRAFSRVDLSQGQKYVPGEVLVRFKPGTSRRAMMLSHARAGGTIKREFSNVEGLQSIKLSSETSVKVALHGYKRDPNVLYAEPNYVLHLLDVPNDPLFPQQWGLSNTGQNGGTTGADIHAPQAWSLTTGSQNVVVAIIDTGIDYNHPDLAANIWSSPTSFTQTYAQYTINCPAGTHGYTPNAATSNGCDPMDHDGHGTHVAGIIGAVGNNGLEEAALIATA